MVSLRVDLVEVKERRINREVVEYRGAKLLEMRRIGLNSFCCGAGGGNYWYEIKRKRRESWLRLDEALETSANMLVVECPFCLAMFEDAVRAMGLEGSIKMKDISELF